MSLTDALADQLRLPSGPLAPLTARTLNRRNHRLIKRTIDALDVDAGHRVLDVGFGGGVSLPMLAGIAVGGLVAGIDPSLDMVIRARRLLAAHIRAGRVVIEPGRVEDIPFGDQTFDRVLSTQTVYFWDELCAGLTELYRVLVPGGRLAIALMARETQESFGFGERGYAVVGPDELLAEMELSGFGGLHGERSPTGEHHILVAERP